MLLREELAGALIYICCWWTMCVCVLHIKWLWFASGVSVRERTHVVTFNHSDVENGDLWVLRRETQEKKNKKWLPQDHRSLTCISSLICDWYDHVVAALLTLVHLLFQLVIAVKRSVVFLRLCCSRRCILSSQAVICAVSYRFIVVAQTLIHPFSAKEVTSN